MITIVDYQMGNLRSVQKSLQQVGAEAIVSADKQVIAKADKLVLPGVGGFGEAIAELRQRDLEAPIREFVASGRPMLGICLGLQLLFETGYEGGVHRGLGLLPGEVVRFEGPAYEGELGLKVPHMGWNQVTKECDAPILRDTPDGTYFYFVHSYYVRPEDPGLVALSCDYGGEFCAMIWRDNLYATQFHPEKSQSAGLKLLRQFAELA